MKKLLLVFILLFCITLSAVAQFQTPTPLSICDDNNDQFATFDLTTKIPEILGSSSANDYVVNFYPSFNDAINNTNVITNPSNYFNVTPAVQTLGIRITNVSTNEFDLNTLDIRLLPAPMVNTSIVTSCFEQGVAYFDLGSVAEAIWSQNNGSPNDFSVAFYQSYTNAISQINELNSTYATQNQFTVLYVNVTNYITGCSTIVPVDLTAENCGTTPCSIPIDITVQNITTTAATINWNGNSNSSFELHITEVNAPAPTANTNGVIVSISNYTITGMVCNAGYTVYVRSLCDNEISEWSVGTTFQTLDCNALIPVSVNNNLSPSQLVCEVLLSNTCATATNVVTQGNCGIGYFNNNNGQFPFAEGVVIRSGNVLLSGGAYATNNDSSGCSQTGDTDLNGIITSLGQSGTTTDVTSVKFNFTAVSNLLSFNFLFASNEYGSYQCNFSDVFGFILTDLTTNVKQNIAVVPGTTTPISTTTIRNNAHNPACNSVNAQLFDIFNLNNPASTVNFRGQTVPMTAFASLIPGRQYSLKLAVGDYQDAMFDSAVFIEGGSFAFGNQCQDNIQLVAFVDSNNNGIKDTGEAPFSQGTFNYVVNNDGNEIVNQSSNGTFYIFPEDVTNSYDITFSVYPELATYFNTSTSYTDVVHVEGGANIYYFPIANPVVHNDIEVNLTSFQNPVPGFSYYNTIIYKNNGISSASGTLEFTYDSALTFLSVSENTFTPITNGFTFNYTNLLPGETRVIYVYFTVPTIPTVSLGQLVTNSVTSINANDIIPTNNSFEFIQEIVGSYDPNDKLESHGGTIAIDEFDTNDYLYYTIRFQNTGTANAQFVRLVDDLDTRLDETSIRMIGASHNYTLTRTDMNLVWKFEQINLPPDIVNSVGSNGYVQFKIKPRPGFAVGDIIPNTAEIYFDYNPAIVTNTFNTEFVETLGNDEFTTTTIAVYPNPARDVVNINNMGTEGISQITIYEVSGKKVFSQTKSFDNLTTINVSDFAKGIYLVELISENKAKLTKKLVIK